MTGVKFKCPSVTPTYERTLVLRNVHFIQPITGQQTSQNFKAVMLLVVKSLKGQDCIIPVIYFFICGLLMTTKDTKLFLRKSRFLGKEGF